MTVEQNRLETQAALKIQESLKVVLDKFETRAWNHVSQYTPDLLPRPTNLFAIIYTIKRVSGPTECLTVETETRDRGPEQMLTTILHMLSLITQTASLVNSDLTVHHIVTSCGLAAIDGLQLELGLPVQEQKSICIIRRSKFAVIAKALAFNPLTEQWEMHSDIDIEYNTPSGYDFKYINVLKTFKN